MDQKPLKISRSGLRLYKECPKCFWLEKHEGIYRPSGYPQALANAIDLLLKDEFDSYRKKGSSHPLLKKFNIQAKLFSDLEILKRWRDTRRGVQYFDEKLNALFFGAVDDVLEFPGGKLAVLDYKTTGSSQANIYDEYYDQMNIYTYLLSMEGYNTADKAYFAFFIADRLNGFEDRLPFKAEIHEVKVNISGIKELFEEAVQVAREDTPPEHSINCEFHAWHHRIKEF